MSDVTGNPKSAGSKSAGSRSAGAKSAEDLPRVTSDHDNRSLGELVSEMTTEFSTLVRQELQLARAEITEEARRAGALAQETVNEARAAAQEDLGLAQQELKEEAKKAGQGAAALAAAAVTGFVALLLVAWTIAWALDNVLPTWAAFLVTGVLFGIVAAIAAGIGRKRLKQVDPKPTRAIEAAKRDATALRDRGRERAQQLNPKPEATIATVREDVQYLQERT